MTQTHYWIDGRASQLRAGDLVMPLRAVTSSTHLVAGFGASATAAEAWPPRLFELRPARAKWQGASSQPLELARELSVEDAFGSRASDIAGFFRSLNDGRWFSPHNDETWRSRVVGLFGEHIRRLVGSSPLPWRMQIGRISSFKALAQWARRELIPSPYLEARGKELSNLITSATPDRLAGAHASAFLATFEVVRAVGAEIFLAAVTESAGGLLLALAPRRADDTVQLAARIVECVGPLADEVPQIMLDAFVMASPNDDVLEAALKVFWERLGARIVERLARVPADVADVCNVVCRQALKSWTLLMRDGLLPTLAAYAGTLTLVSSHKLNAFEPLLEMARLGAIPLGTTAPDRLVVFTRALS